MPSLSLVKSFELLVRMAADPDKTETIGPSLHRRNSLLQAGCSNLIVYIQTVLKSGSKPVVCINSFHTDTPAEHALIQQIAEEAGARCAISEHWLKGGEGASELAQQVIDAAEEPNTFAYLYETDTPIRTRVEKIATEIYGADGVDWSREAQEKLNRVEADSDNVALGICMVKTHLSLSHDPMLKGAPKGWRLPIQDLLIYRGAGFLVPAGDIKLYARHRLQSGVSSH